MYLNNWIHKKVELTLTDGRTFLVEIEDITDYWVWVTFHDMRGRHGLISRNAVVSLIAKHERGAGNAGQKEHDPF